MVRYVLVQHELTVGTPEQHGVRRLDGEPGAHGLVAVGNTVWVAALDHADHRSRHGDPELFHDLEIPDDVNGRPGGDQRDGVHFLGLQLPVLDLYHVLTAHGPAGDVHEHAHHGACMAADPEDLQYVKCLPGLDMVDHGPVVDGLDPEFPVAQVHAKPPYP